MKPQWDNWLPPGVAEREDVRRALAAAVEQWAQAWFGTSRPGLVNLRNADRTSTADDQGICWQSGEGSVSTGVSRQARTALAAIALGPEIERLVLTETERDIVDGFLAELLKDLSRRVERAFHCGDDVPNDGRRAAAPFAPGGLLAEIDLGPAGPLRIAVPMSVIIAFCRTSMPAPDPAPPISAVAKAVAASRVTVSAVLGSAHLPLGDFMSLVAGDVLILDRRVDEGADLLLEPATKRFARGGVYPGADGIALTLQSDRRHDENAN